MTLSLWIPQSLQYGALAQGEALQQRSLRRQLQYDLAQAIKRQVFQTQDSADSTDTPSYDRVLRHFAEAFESEIKIDDQWSTVQHLWEALLSERSAPSAKVSKESPPERPVATSIESLFCLALHTLCAKLAGQWMPNLHSERAEDGEAEDDEDDAEEALVPASDAPAVEYSEVRHELATQLSRHTWVDPQQLPENTQPQYDDWRLVAEVLLDTLLDALGDWVSVQTGATRHVDGKPRTPKRIEVQNADLTARLERLIEMMPLRVTAQPLSTPLAYIFDDAEPPEEGSEGCLRLDLINSRQTNQFVRETRRKIIHPEHRPVTFERYVAAVNQQQTVPWRVNRPLLDCTRALIGVVEEKTVSETHTDLCAWVRKKLYRPQSERPRPGSSSKRKRDPEEDPKPLKARAGEFLDSPLATRALDVLCPSDPQTEPPAFYLPWKSDYRGRIYAETAWLTPQGGDLQRALLEFAHGEVLTESGVRALRRHGANLVNRDVLLTGISDRLVLTLEERERWVEAHQDQILASAASPLTETFWREVSDEPMQFLAFCLAYREWTQNPQAPVHLPVQIDGTCNGLQHIAALTGDAALAEAVNVQPRADGLPADIYSELAQAARQRLGQTAVGKRQTTHRQGLEQANAWLAADPAQHETWLNRKTAKKVVMTIPYGASHEAQACGVLEAIEKKLLEACQERPLSETEWTTLMDWKQANKVRQRFVRTCTKDRFTEKWQAAFPPDTARKHAPSASRVVKSGQKTPRARSGLRSQPPAPSERSPAYVEWDRLCTLGAYVALALVEHLHAALDSEYPSVNAFSGWLGECAKAGAGTAKHAGLPLLWLTPLGFPVIQNKFKVRKTSATVRLGAKSISLDVQKVTEQVDPNQQKTALLPNLIHGLDATHLMLTLLAAESQGVCDVGSIHDCLLCHPNQAEVLSQIVRATFAELYAPDEQSGLAKPLSEWYHWMQQVAELRGLPRRGFVLAAFNHPGKLAEANLENDAKQQQEDALQACAWLHRLRAMAPPEQFLLTQLLRQAALLTTPETLPRLSAPPVSRTLTLSAEQMSPYFFS